MAAWELITDPQAIHDLKPTPSEYAMSGEETYHQQLAAADAEERDEQERKRRSRHTCSWCGERLDPADYYRLERMDVRLHLWTERFCSLGHAALWIGE